MSVTDIIFGITNDNNDNLIDVFNYSILFAKQFIYNCKISRSHICFVIYQNKLIARLEVERHLATSQNKLKDFYIKWDDILMLRTN